jgi:hypothetical protein
LINALEEHRKMKILHSILDFFGKLHLGPNYKTEEELKQYEVVSQEYYEDYEEYLKNAGSLG